MEKISVKEILEATNGRLVRGIEHKEFSHISTDTRTLKNGDLFIALKGKNFDGHKFIAEAFKRGAEGVIKSKRVKKLKIQGARGRGESIIIEVNDTLRALQDIANFYRRRFDVPLIAVTGSNGKTTTKEMLWNIFSMIGPTLKNEGNYNNQIGVPLTLFELDRSHKFAVLEFGTNIPGEIKRLTEIAQPVAGVITNIGLVHTEGLSDIDGVKKEKFSLLSGLLGSRNAILNIDDKIISKSLSEIKKQKLNITTYGILNKADVYATEINDLREKGIRFTINLAKNKNTPRKTIHIPLIGTQNVYNALASTAAADLFDVSLSAIKNGLENMKTLPMHMEIIRLKDITIINDAYNANPDSVEKAISIIQNWNARRKILVLGNMLELGKWSVSAHKKLASVVLSGGIDILFAVGKFASLTAEEFKSKGGSAFIYENSDKVSEDILKDAGCGDLILIKGSRAMGMEKIAEKIRKTLLFESKCRQNVTIRRKLQGTEGK